MTSENESQPLAKVRLQPEDLVKVNEAIGLLHDYGFSMRATIEALGERLSEQRRQPTEQDRLYPWEPPISLDDHISMGDTRVTLSSRVVKGRAYSLTPGQRDVIREWFGITPAPLVEVTELVLFEGTNYIRQLRLTSLEHVDPRRRRVMKSFTLAEWGKFSVLARQKDQEREEAKESTKVADGDKPDKVTKSGKKTKTQLELEEEYAL